MPDIKSTDTKIDEHEIGRQKNIPDYMKMQCAFSQNNDRT